MTSSASPSSKEEDIQLLDAKNEEDEEKVDVKKKRKKLPSCDACKLRRVLCHPVAAPLSCPRCSDKGIQCTTTPTVRKRPAARTGKRIEEARATFGAADLVSPHLATPSNAPWIQPRFQLQPRLTGGSTSTYNISSSDTEARLSLAELNGALAAELIEGYHHLPQSWLPLFPRGRLSLQFEEAGRRLEALSPQVEVLAYTVMAITSRISSNPLILGPGEAPEFGELTMAYLAQGHRDLREFGRRREPVCSFLRQKAIKLAWERGTMVQTSEESMACCNLLEILEGRDDPKGGKPYGSAFVSHLRTLLDASSDGMPRTINMPLGWSALMMREASYAANTGRTSHFTPADDLLLCGPVPPSIEEAIMETVDDIDVRDSVNLFFKPMRPYTYHAARLSRECSDRITGTASRRQPLDERYVTKFLTQLDHLYHVFDILRGRIAFVLSPKATDAHALPAPFEQERKYIMQACLYTIQLGWAALSLPLYVDLNRRLAELTSGPTATSDELRRARERLEVLKQQVHRSALRGARLAASAVSNAPSLAFLQFLRQERLDTWIEILYEARTAEEGGEGITQAEKLTELQWMLDGLKSMGYAWTGDEDLIETLENRLQSLNLDHLESSANSASTTANLGIEEPFDDPTINPDLLSASVDFGTFLTSSSGDQLLSGVFDYDAMLSASIFGAGAAAGGFQASSTPGDLDWATMVMDTQGAAMHML